MLAGFAAGLACWVVLGAAQLAGAFDAFDLRLLDWRFRLRGERPAADAIALVAIDDPTIRAYGGWPLPRDQYALLLQAIADAGARAVGVDLQLPDDANHEPRHNALLAYVAGEHPSVVHAVSFLSDDMAPASHVPTPSLAALRRHGVVDTNTPVPEATSVSVPYPELMEQAAALGHITVAADRDGAIRRQPFLVRFEDRVYPSLTLRMLGAGGGGSGPPRAEAAPGGVRVGWGGHATWKLPLDREGATPLDFAGDRRSFRNTHSMIDVLQDLRANDLGRLRDRFAGRYVLVGLDSRTEVTEDVGTSPFAAATPLMFLHANALDNLLRGRFLRRPPPAVFLGALGVTAGALGGLIVALPMAAAALVAAGSVLAIGAIDLALLSRWAIDAPPLAALLLVPSVYAAATSGRYLFLESRSRQREAEIREGRSVEQQFLPEAMIGHDLSRYRVVEKLGGGAMGVVYRGRDPRLGRDVAIKVLPARALADERARRRFRREAQALSRLNHPHIAAIHDFDSQAGTDFLVMEFVPGVPLTQRFRRGAMAESDVVRVMNQVASALVEAHGHGVIHRDLKPENIMITRAGDVKVLDFGIALILDSGTGTRLTEIGHMVGTLPYMPPEVIRGVKAEPRSDLYSLGVIGFEMATGRRPFPNDEPHELMYTIMHQTPPQPRILNGRISERLEAVILQLLAKQPEERFASAQSLLEMLNALATPETNARRASNGANHGSPHG
jgi:CHASE2 domain-containing sensor protein/predicted Ser/Thr protein kinase